MPDRLVPVRLGTVRTYSDYVAEPLDEPLFEGVGAALHRVVESDNDAAARRLLDLFASPGLHCANTRFDGTWSNGAAARSSSRL